ncbi:MAG TPA: hypothetical protein VGD26_04430, partial [Chitinophagaceae bacterium]
MDSSDKITLIKYPGVPSCCAICRRGSDGELDFVDFQLSVDYYGAIVICTTCIAPVAQVLGYVHEDNVTSVKDHAHVLSLEVERLIKENERLRNTMDSVLAFRPDLKRDDSDANEAAVEDSGEEQLAFDLDSSGEGSNDPVPPKSA